MQRSTLPICLLSAAIVLSAAGAARADQSGNQRYPNAYVDRPLTLPSFGLSPDVTFDVSQIVQNPGEAQHELQTNLAFGIGAGFGITEDLEVRASIGTLRFLPEFQYLEPRVQGTFRFVGAENVNVGVRADVVILTVPGDEGVRLEASLPLLLRLGSSARLDLAPGVPIVLRGTKRYVALSDQVPQPGQPISIQERKAVAFGLDVPVAFAFQIVDVINIGARTAVSITDFENPGANLVIPLGFFVGISLGSERPIVELDPYFTWNEFSRPGAKFDNDKVNIEKFSAGLTARLYLYL